MTESLPPDISSGFLRAYFVFDVADQIDLSRLSAESDRGYQPDQIKFNITAAPSYIQFAVAPMVAHLAPIEVEGRQAEVRLKIFDYGTIAVRISFPYQGDWEQFSKLSRDFRASRDLVQSADQILQNVLKEVRHVFTEPHETLVEDYFVAEVTSFSGPMTATSLIQAHKASLASLVSGELVSLSPGEQDEALRIRFSYFDTEIGTEPLGTCPSHSGYRQDGADTVESIIEFANTQLVELRSYDRLLDKHLDEIYKWKSERQRSHGLFGQRVAERRAEKLRYLLVDIQELSDRANNALKMIGDAYYARLYRGVAARFALSDWQNQIESKLESVGAVYRFANDQAQHARSELLEMIVVALIGIEILIGLISLYH